MEAVKDALLINAYWFSFPVIGYALLNLLFRWKRLSEGQRNIISLILDQNILIVGLASFALAAVVLGIVALVGYLFTAPVVILSVWYVLLLTVSIVFIALQLWRNLFTKKPIDLFGFKNQTLLARLAFIGFCTFAIIDFIVATQARSHAALGSDTYVHLSRIVAMLSQGLTIESGFFRDIPEVGYHMNLIYALYAVPAQLFGITPSVVWEYSFGFFRLIQWVGIFTLAWYVCAVWLKDRVNALFGASLTAMFAIGYFSMAFFIAVYPNQVVGLWLTMLVISLSQYDANRKAAAVPALLAAFLIMFTHPTYAMMAGMFIGLLFITRLIVQRNEFKGVLLRQTAKLYAAIIAILSISPLRSAFMPNHMTEAGVNVLKYDTINVGFLSMKQPAFSYVGKVGTMLMLLGVFGLLFLLYRLWKNKRQWAIAFSLVMFYPIMVYIPFTYSILEAVFPVWLIDRFTAMNVLNFIGVPLGVYGLISIMQALSRKYNLPRWVSSQRTGILAFAAFIVVVGSYYMVLAPGKVTQYQEQNKHYYQFMDRTYQRFHTTLNDEKMVVAHRGDSYFLASVLPIDVVAIEDTHTTPSADAKDRLACQAQLLRTMRYTDLRAIDADYLVLSTYEKDFKRERKLAESKPYLKFVEGNADFYVYQFLPDKSDSKKLPYKPCVEYQKIEKE